MMDLFSLAKPPYGYRCHDCNHVWPARSPCGSKLEVMEALHHAKTACCPKCRAAKVCVVSPQRYAQLKAERERQAMGASAA